MEKKEIWKLLELLNEYSKEIWYFNADDLQWQVKAWILSKEFWWIERLVEQDKIDRDKFEIEYIDKQTLNDVYIAWAKKDELLIMLLSISEQPIDLLISLLKDGK
jgi:hypothetical protein